MAKIIVGMSGGVDSAVCAYLLKAAGHDVIGVTLKTWIASDGRYSRCCEIDEARNTAWQIGIPYYVRNCVAEFEKYITNPFANSYLSGLTPNPCVLCNRSIKWDEMLRMADELGADYVATGHYATVVRNGDRYTLKKAVHTEKDQTYMLYRLTQEQLSRTIMPLGKLRKDEVREIAQTASLSVSHKADSQEICFVTEGNYADYIVENARSEIPREGDFIDEAGHVIGRHRGIIHYTVGQRRGLNLALGYPAYVKEIRADSNTIVVGDEKSLYTDTVYCANLCFMGVRELPSGASLPCNAKIRYHHREQLARLTMINDDTAVLHFEEPVRAACPGQSAVFYDEEGCLIGGGIIIRDESHRN